MPDSININKSLHPAVLIVLILFKGLPVILYLFSGIFFGSDILAISVTTILAALDFWFMKNIAGRKLVGLRWSRIIHPDG